VSSRLEERDDDMISGNVVQMTKRKERDGRNALTIC
jgi:hypothetical protein